MSQYHWEESFRSLGDAISRLEEVLDTPLDDHRVVIDATIQRFEFTFELLWKNLKRFLSKEGIEVRSPRETLKKAYQLHWLDNEEVWLKMMHDRNATCHIYDEDKAHEIYERIRLYTSLIKSVYEKLESHKLSP